MAAIARLGAAPAAMAGFCGAVGARHMSTIMSRATTAAVVRRAQRRAALEAATAPPPAAPALLPLAPAGDGLATGAAATAVATVAVQPSEAAARRRPVDAASLVARAAGELAAAGRLHDETMSLIESSEEWRDYDAHVTFELHMLRHRYTVEAGAAGRNAMDTARRTQLQEHLRQKQAAIMAEHAEEVAGEMVALMTAEERAALSASLWRIDAPVPASGAALEPAAAAAPQLAAAAGRAPTPTAAVAAVAAAAALSGAGATAASAGSGGSGGGTGSGKAEAAGVGRDGGAATATVPTQSSEAASPFR